ncbi:MAG: DUF3089 domain-containing protein [Solirubrobacteraceae bacterium]
MYERETEPRPQRRRADAHVAGRLAVAVVLTAVALFGLSATASAKSSTVWLCKPGKKPDPCLQERTATVVTYAGTERHEAIQKPIKHGAPPIDCFYVYPTVSEQAGPNANLTIEPQETQIAIDQASRFSQDCKVYAPMYPQLTLAAINNPGGVTLEDEVKAYEGVLGGFLEYMHRYNKGRGIVLIGHSQGSLMLENLIKQEFDGNPVLRKQLVSAIILGGNVLVPEGKLEGGTFQNVPTCTSATDTACVIAYSTFLKEPPENSFFGRPDSPLLGGPPPPPGEEVVCVNPTLLTQNGSAGALLPYAPTTPFPGILGAGSPTPTASTPWVETAGIYKAQCKHENGATWLQPGFVEGVSEPVINELTAHNEVPVELIGPEWGLHLYDVNVALGNLVNTVALQTQAYGFEH